MAMQNSDAPGTEGWWQQIASQGTPIVIKRSDGSLAATFYWRDPEGSEQTSPWQYIWLNITGITDHHQTEAPLSLQRITGTDVWYATLTLPANWRGSYCFLPDSTVAPQHAQLTLTTRRDWWQGKIQHCIPDALNPLRSWQSAKGHWTSPLHMPSAPAQDEWRETDNGTLSLNTPVCRFEWASTQLNNRRQIAFFSTREHPNIDHPLVIILDGEFWLTGMPIMPVLYDLTAQGQLPEAVYVFIDSVNNSLRSAELPCNEAFWMSVKEELLPQLRSKIAFSQQATKTVLVGQSFGGLSALYAALRWPERFACVLSQSASLWWPERDVSQNSKQRAIAELLLQSQTAHYPLSVALDAGRYENIILQSHRQLMPVLDSRIDTLRYREVEGGHDALCWRGGIISGLKWLWSSEKVT
ncbi:MAG: Enterochelin esterase [Candidatus Erwinia impunctatus]|nr:Enterochelin esterase [Culicoides impunctatus]